MHYTLIVILVVLTGFGSDTFSADTKLSADPAVQALCKAVRFYHKQVASFGGYVYQYSGDLKLREGEGKASPTMIWVQPPGTPTVGEAFLDAYDAAGAKESLPAAQDAANALVLGQLHSGGWHYHINFDPQKRREFNYRLDTKGRRLRDPVLPKDRNTPAGWDTWKKRKYKGNKTILDDDTTQAALRFLMRMDRVLNFQDERIHEAVEHGLNSLLNIQYANGAWSANYDRFQTRPPDSKLYPRKKSSYPASWPRKWPKDFTGCYVTNDNLMANMIKTMLRAWEIYQDKRYLQSAERAGEFLLLAQMPEPQPAWAQQYDRNMQPVWDRAFEPASISGRESQDIMLALLQLYSATGDKKYLEPIPRAIAYLRKSRLPDGSLSRFYELRTNRPIFFTRDRDGRHQMTYRRDRLATNYAFVIESRLDVIEADYRRLENGGSAERKAWKSEPIDRIPVKEIKSLTHQIIRSMDSRGAWVERERLRHHKIEPKSGIIESQTFADNIKILCRYINTHP